MNISLLLPFPIYSKRVFSQINNISKNNETQYSLSFTRYGYENTCLKY